MKCIGVSMQKCPLPLMVVLLLSYYVNLVLTQSESSEEIKCHTLPPPPKIVASTTLSQNLSTKQIPNKDDKQQQILSRGMEQLYFDRVDKKAIFMLGNTGAGKTTITQTLNGNLSQLHAVKTHGGQMVIIDEQQRIGLPTTNSKTLVPEYVRNPENNVSFYDCPGFDDNRGADSDIAAMYFVSAITEHVKQAKFLFIVTHSSVKMGHDRLDFDLLATHASQFLLNMTKFGNSIGLIVSKVSSFSDEGKYVSDRRIMSGVVGFLREFHSTLQEKLEGAEHKDVGLLQRKVQFVEALLAQDSNKNYIRIWFVRGPPKCGAFSEMPYYTEAREKITDLYAKKLVYSPTVSTDFGITLKDKTLLKVKSEYIPQLLEKYNNITDEAVDELLAIYQEEFENDLKTEILFRESLLKLNNVYHNLSSMRTESNPFSNDIKNVFLSMEYGLPEAYVNETRKIEDVLRFYEKVTMTSIRRPSISLFIRKLYTEVRDLREEVFSFIKETSIQNILSNMTSSADQALSTLMRRFQTKFKTNFSSENSRKDAIISLTNVAKNLQNFTLNSNQSEYRFSQELTRLSETIGISLPPTFIDQTLHCEDMLQFFENVTTSPIIYPSLTTFLTTVQSHVRDIKDKAILKIVNTYVPQLLVEFNSKTETTTDELFANYKHEFDGDFNTDERVRNSLLKLNMVYHNLSTMQTQSYTFSEGIETLFHTLEYAVPEVYVNETEKIEDFFKFYESVTNAPIIRPSITSSIQKLQTKVRDLRDEKFSFIKETSIPNTLANIQSSTTQVLNTLLGRFQTQFETNFNIENSRTDSLIRLTNVATNLHNFTSTPNQGQSIFLQEIARLSETIGYSLPASFINEVLECENLLQFYENVTMSPITYLSPTPFLNNARNRIRDIKDKALAKIKNEYVPELLDEYNNKTLKVVAELLTNYQHKFEGDFNTDDRLRESLLKLKNTYNTLSSASSQSLSFLGGIRNLFRTMEYELSGTYVNEINRIEKVLQFYENVTMSKIAYPSLTFFLTNVHGQVRNIKENVERKIIRECVPQLLEKYNRKTDEVVDEVFANYNQEFQGDFYGNVRLRESLLKLNRINNKLTSIQTQSDSISEGIRKMFLAMESAVPNVYVENTRKIENVLKFYENLTLTTIARPSFTLILQKLQSKVRVLRDNVLSFIKDTTIPNIFANILAIVTNLVSEAEKSYVQEDFYSDLTRLSIPGKVEVLKVYTQKMRPLREKWESDGNPSIATEMGNFYSKLDRSIPVDKLVELRQLENLLVFLEEVTGSPIQMPTRDWLRIPLKLVRKLEYLHDWYEFLVLTDNKFKLYTTQREIHNLRTSTIVSNFEASINILRIIPGSFLSSNIENIAENQANEVDKAELLNIVRNAFASTKIRCLSQGRKAVVTGNYVKFTDFMTSSGELPCGSSLEEMEVFASEKLFFDRDVQAIGRELTIKVIADVWEVIDTRTINLKGANGEPHVPAKAQGSILSTAGYATDGEAGQPGRPGGNGGNFYGIYGKIVNAEKLTVNVNGGDGGDGQEGANGKDGVDGRDAQRKDFPSPRDTHLVTWERKGKAYEYGVHYEHRHVMAGQFGEEGGNGGNGGIGGEPGYPGTFSVSQSNSGDSLSGILVRSQRGKSGQPGKGGNAGTGGSKGHSYSCLRTYSLFRSPYWQKCFVEHRNVLAAPGREGLTGRNSDGKILPIQPIPRIGQINWGTIADFRSFIVESGSMNGRKFVTAIDSKP